MAYIMTTEAEIQQKSGAGVNVAFNTTMMTASNIRAESLVCCIARYDLSTAYAAGLQTIAKFLLNDICSSFVAIEAISYDMSGYTSRIEAEDMINILRDGMLRNLAILRDMKVREFIING